MAFGTKFIEDVQLFYEECSKCYGIWIYHLHIISETKEDPVFKSTVLPRSIADSYFLFANFVDFYTHWTYMLIFRRIFLSNYWWQKSDIWSQASYRYPISWEAFLDPSDSYFLFADFVDFYTHLTYICICTFFVAFFSATIDDRNLIFGHKLHICMPYCGKRFWTRQIPTSCLPT